MSSATWMPRSGRSSCAAALRDRPDAEGAGGPQAAAGHRAPRGAAGDLHERRRAALGQGEAARGREEAERGSRRRRGPALVGAGVGFRDRPPQRAAAVATVGSGRVDGEVDTTVHLAASRNASWTLADAVASARMGGATTSSTPWSVSSSAATPATAQPSATRSSMMAGLRSGPNTRAPRRSCSPADMPGSYGHGSVAVLRIHGWMRDSKRCCVARAQRPGLRMARPGAERGGTLPRPVWSRQQGKANLRSSPRAGPVRNADDDQGDGRDPRQDLRSRRGPWRRRGRPAQRARRRRRGGSWRCNPPRRQG